MNPLSCQAEHHFVVPSMYSNTRTTFLHAAGGARDFHRRLGLFARDQPEQVDHAAFGHHLHVVGREGAAVVDEARLDLGGEVAVVGAGVYEADPGNLDLVDHAAHIGDLAHDSFDLRFGGGVGRFAGEQHVAVVAGDVDVHFVAEAVADAAFAAQGRFPCPRSALRASAGHPEASAVAPAPTTAIFDATLQLRRERQQRKQRKAARSGETFLFKAVMIQLLVTRCRCRRTGSAA